MALFSGGYHNTSVNSRNTLRASKVLAAVIEASMLHYLLKRQKAKIQKSNDFTLHSCSWPGPLHLQSGLSGDAVALARK